MNVNDKFLITPGVTGKTITIPLEIKWDFGGREDSIELYEEDVIEQIIGEPKDFEVLRFAHNEWTSRELDNLGNNIVKTDITYQFYFFTGIPATVSATTTFNLTNKWTNSYLPTFAPTEIYYFSRPFIKSFFKLDFYDTNNPLTQKNYFTVIIPTQQGEREDVIVSPSLPISKIKRPKFILDYLGDKEGFFFYWLTDRNFLDLTTFYMSAKFFDAKNGVFVPMINLSQAVLPIGNRFNFTNPAQYFYYKVVFNYTNKTYEVFNATTNGRVTTINWFEYVNP